MAQSAVVAEAEVVEAPSGSVPRRVKKLFEKFDTDGNGRLTLEEWQKAVALEFPHMPAHAEAHVAPVFAKHATSTPEHPHKFVDLPTFSKMYASLLFRNFDADNSGLLDATEAEAALSYLSEGKAMRLALPLGKDASGADTKVGKSWFWAMYKTMMDT
uniref:EF-hand domain-containing protein n=1 Tax=Chrysotila carterae TaxID=13221 RepID=A0A6T0C968_CHRCT|mmetsp:Transcript_7246/g.14213  ORF Transcript_7246/g.14213 Transcript_7246/m.14213 type:complete len:158 (+) Transcript_7246:78-551(+)